MNWLIAVIKLVLLSLSIWREEDRVRKEIKKGAAQMYKEAIRDRNPDKMKSGDARLKNL